MSSSSLRLAAIGAGAGLSGLFLEAAISEETDAQALFGPIVGGAIGAAAVNANLPKGARYRPGGAVLFMGGVAGLAGSLLAKRLIPSLSEPTTSRGRIVLFGLLGASFGGAASALSLQGLVPPELQITDR